MIEDLLIQGTRWGQVYLSKVEKTEYNPVKYKVGSNVIYGKDAQDLLKLCDHNGDFRIEREKMRVLKVKDSGKEYDFEKYFEKK
jgi:hypothetical protein